MIRINLLGEKADKSGVYALHVLAYCSTVFCTLGVCFFLQNQAWATVDKLRQDKGVLDGKLAKLKEETKQVAELEQKKKLLQEKLLVIATLKANKQGPVHILDDINTAIPERAWLVSIKEKAGTLEISGVALDNQTITLFMQKLKESKYFHDIDLVVSAEYVQDNVKLKQFSIAVQLKNALELKGIKTPDAKGSDEKDKAKTKAPKVPGIEKKL